ncbi:MAG: hypothetical protein L3J86_05730, partial [Thermoplasmata archaeon]|nr:hypothetical protein [Thermoplasmata archaeon]
MEEPADQSIDDASPPRRSAVRSASDDSWILDELDGLRSDLTDEALPPPIAPTPRARAAPPRAVVLPLTRDVWGSPSPYLEERLGAATRAVSGVGAEMRELTSRTERLQQTLETLEQELDRATQEVSFIREHGLEGQGAPVEGTVPPTPADAPESRTPTRCRAVRSPSSPEVPAPESRYERFTAARYNTTMSDLQGRRRRVAAAALLIAAGISFALVAVAFAAHEATPPLWLAVLPGIWMIPVPFFALSFRGTHR